MDIKEEIVKIEFTLRDAGVSIMELCRRSKTDPKTFRRWRSGDANPLAAFNRVQAVADAIRDEHENYAEREG